MEEVKIFRNFPHPFRRRRTRLISLKMVVFAVIVPSFVLCVVSGHSHLASEMQVGGSLSFPSKPPKQSSPSSSSSPSPKLISTNFAALKNNTFRLAAGKKFGKYFLSKKLTTSAHHPFHDPNLKNNGTKPTGSSSTSDWSTKSTPDWSTKSTPKWSTTSTVSPKPSMAASPASSSSQTTTKPSTTLTTRLSTKPTTRLSTKPTTTTTTQGTTVQSTRLSSTSTTPMPDFITRISPNLNGDLTGPSEMTAENVTDKTTLFDNFYEVLPVPSGFGVKLKPNFSSKDSNVHLQQQLEAEQIALATEMAIAMHPDPDNLAYQDTNDLDVPDQIAMGSDFGPNVAIAHPPSPQPTGQSRIGGRGRKQSPRRRQGQSSNFPQSFEMFGVKDSIFYRNGPTGPTQVPTVSGPSPGFTGPSKNDPFRHGRKLPSGFPGTPPPASQVHAQTSQATSFHKERVTHKPNTNGAHKYSKGGLQEITPFMGPSGNARVHTGPSGNGRVRTGPSGNGRVHAGPSGSGRVHAGPSGNGRVHTGPSGNARVHTGPSGNGRVHTGPSGNGRVHTGPSGNGRVHKSKNHNNHNQPPSSHNIRTNPNPNVRAFSPYNPTNQPQNPPGPLHINSVSNVRQQGSKGIKTHYHGRGQQGSQSHSHSHSNNQGSFKPITRPNSLPVNHPNSWNPTPPVHPRPVFNHNSQAHKRKDNLQAQQSQIQLAKSLVHPGNFGPHPTTPPPASHVQMQASGSFLGSFDVGGMPQVHNPPQSTPVLRPNPPHPQNQHQQQMHGSNFNQFESGFGSAGLSGPDGGHSHAPQHRYQGPGPHPHPHHHGQSHPSQNNFQGPPHAHHAPQQPLTAVPIIIPQTHFQGPPPQNLNLGPPPQNLNQQQNQAPPNLNLNAPPLNEFNIRPVPQGVPKPAYRQLNQNNPHQQQNHHHQQQQQFPQQQQLQHQQQQQQQQPQHTPNNQNQANYFNNVQQFPPPPAAPQQAPAGNNNNFGDFGGFHGSTIPLPENLGGNPELGGVNSFANFAPPNSPQNLGSNLNSNGLQLQPVAQQGSQFNHQSHPYIPDSPWIPKPRGHSHRHRHHHHQHSSHGFEDFATNNGNGPDTVLAGLPGGNTPLMPQQPQVQMPEDYNGEIEKNDADVEPQSLPQSHFSIENGFPRRNPGENPNGIYELPAPPNLQYHRHISDPGSREEPVLDIPSQAPELANDQSQGSDGSSAEGDNGPPGQPGGDLNVFNHISGEHSSGQQENPQGNEGSNEAEQEVQSFQSHDSPGFGGGSGENFPQQQQQEQPPQQAEPNPDFTGFSVVEPPKYRRPKLLPNYRQQEQQRQQEQEQQQNYGGGYSNEENQGDPGQNQQQNPPYEPNNVGFQDFGNFPGQQGNLDLNQNVADEPGSNELGEGDFRQGPGHSAFTAAPHFQTGPPPLVNGNFQQDGPGSNENSASIEQEPNPGGAPGSPEFNGFTQQPFRNLVSPRPRQQQQQQAPPPSQLDESPVGGPGPDFIGGLTGFNIGPNIISKPLFSPSAGPGISGPILVGPIGGAVPFRTPEVGNLGQQKQGNKDHAPLQPHHKDPHHQNHHQHHHPSHHPRPGLFSGLGGLLGPLRGFGLMRGLLAGHNKHSQFNFPGKHEFNFGKDATAFDFEKHKEKIIKPYLNFGNEGFQFGKNNFNFGKDGLKFGKDPFGKAPFGQDPFVKNPLGVLKKPLVTLKKPLVTLKKPLVSLKKPLLTHPLALKHNVKLPVGKVIKAIVALGHKILSFYAKLSIPKDHYVRVISFAGVYLFFAWLLKDNEQILYPKCEKWGWTGPEEFLYHAPAYYVPAIPVDQHMQNEFFDLFRGVENCLDVKIKKEKKKRKKKKDKKKKKKDNDKKNGNKKSRDDLSSEEDDDVEDDEDSIENDYNDELGFINQMCPKDRFFFSMSPYHIEAWSALAKMFAEQKTPADVLHLARSLLLSHRVNPKVWYLALHAAAGQRPDMLGFQLAHPIYAIPDLFIPGTLIEGDMARYRGLPLDAPATSSPARIKRATVSFRSFVQTLKESLNGTLFRGSVKDRYQRFMASRGLNGTTTTTAATTTTTTTRGTTTTSRPPLYTYTPSAVMLERMDAINFHTTTAPLNTSILKERKGEESDSDEYDDDDDYGKDVKKPFGYGFGFGKTKGSREAGSNGNSLGRPITRQGGNGFGNGIGGGNRVGGQGGRPGAFGNGQGGQGGQGQGQGNRKKSKGKKGKGKKKKDKKKKCIIVDGSVGLDNGIENKLWYFREDLMMNQHHWYWHSIYPVNASIHTDRRSELFFFMHRSMVARYNAERLSNGFDRCNELVLQQGVPIEEGYNAHLKDFNSGEWWTPRAAKTPMRDVYHTEDPDHAQDIIVNDILDLYNKFVKAIRIGKLYTADGKFLPIRFANGIEPLGNAIESSNLSVNPFYYDMNGLHNLGNILVGLQSDPEYRTKAPSGVMAEAGVSMRDPTFYTFHTMLDNLFDKFKKTLTPYKPYGGVWPLQWHGVDLVDVKIQMQGLGESNQLVTFFIKHKFQLEPGVDRSIAKGIQKADVCAVHLDHAPFQYQITIDRKKCSKSKSGLGTVRIFMAPRFNEHGDRIPLYEQRRLMFELDVFQAELKVGRNIITRNSRDSSLTRPWTRSLKDFEKGPYSSGDADYCGCGWPHHLLIPKGNTKGMAFDLFVMVTNFDEDFVADHPVDLEYPEPCNSPYIFCGRPRRRYPDSRPMGYPFDRLPYHVPAKTFYGYGHSMKELLCKLTGKLFTRPVATLEEYVSGSSNMAMAIFEIKHIPKVIGKHKG